MVIVKISVSFDLHISAINKYSSIIIANLKWSEIMLLKMLRLYKVKLGMPDNNMLMFFFYLLKKILIL